MIAANATDLKQGRLELVITRILDAPPVLVYKAWTSPEHMARWMGPEGFTAPSVKLDVREGGAYHWCIKNPSFGECWTIGSYVEVRRPERLVFTATIADADGLPRTPESQGHDPAWPPETTIRVTFTERAGRTIVTLAQDVSERHDVDIGHGVSLLHSKTDQLTRCASNSSAAVPISELPLPSRPGDHTATEQTPGTTAMIPPPTPLLPGRPTRKAKSPEPS